MRRKIDTTRINEHESDTKKELRWATNDLLIFVAGNICEGGLNQTHEIQSINEDD